MRDSCGTGGQVRHLKVKRYECGSPPAPRKTSTWNGNQPLPKATKYAKTAFKIDLLLCMKRL
ncbi:hypothetical protein QUF49_15865 [Fictibacillus sp. b24]|uniref:hypothetical protein n=1 Tax=Fictibacillus sp. b24 TaxID=3055863 RepID=UPI0025A1681E|nr:hypothetical protein [Fictibacillus sp. b24]MDM5317488.1 hypothetical protein [Fictibacillus sp. b24]